MRSVALELIARMHRGHENREFSIPVVDFIGIFAPDAPAAELAKVAERGDLRFTANDFRSGTFSIARGERALFDLRREGLVLRIPVLMSGRYELRPGAFTVYFDRGAELEGCKRIVLLVCNRVNSVDVSGERVDVRLPGKIFDLCVEFS